MAKLDNTYLEERFEVDDDKYRFWVIRNLDEEPGYQSGFIMTQGRKFIHGGPGCELVRLIAEIDGQVPSQMLRNWIDYAEAEMYDYHPTLVEGVTNC